MKYRVEVTEDDIKYGTRMSLNSCPIALAVRRSTGKRVQVYDKIEVYPTFPECIVPTPDDALKFIRSYDDNALVVPFSFVLELP